MTARRVLQRGLLAAFVCTCSLAVGFSNAAEPAARSPLPARDWIAVRNPKRLPPKLPCERIAMGEPGDYKACIARLPSGELLLTMFHQYSRPGGKVLEQNLLFRSRDGGCTWAGPEKLALLGREPYPTVLSNGTIFVTGHLLAQDVRNKHGYIHGYLHRSTDGGKTWESIRVDSTQLGRPGVANHTSRNVLERADGTLLLGADCNGGPYYVWRSLDGGKSWDRSQRCTPIGFRSRFGFFGGETWLWQARSGKIIALVRVDSREFPIPGRRLDGTGTDEDDHEMLWESTDGGRTFRPVGHFGGYGQMYPSLLRLQDGRLLYTYTQRALDPPLGLRAVVGTERRGELRFDFSSDILLLDPKTGSREQGGGFGPTVQLKDGTLVTSYTYRGADNQTHAEVVRWRLPK